MAASADGFDAAGGAGFDPRTRVVVEVPIVLARDGHDDAPAVFLHAFTGRRRADGDALRDARLLRTPATSHTPDRGVCSTPRLTCSSPPSSSCC